MGFAISHRCEQVVGEELQRLGVKKDRYILVSVPVTHPITLNEARAVFDV